jgi:hypothetical protein
MPRMLWVELLSDLDLNWQDRHGSSRWHFPAGHWVRQFCCMHRPQACRQEQGAPLHMPWPGRRHRNSRQLHLCNNGGLYHVPASRLELFEHWTLTPRKKNRTALASTEERSDTTWATRPNWVSRLTLHTICRGSRRLGKWGCRWHGSSSTLLAGQLPFFQRSAAELECSAKPACWADSSCSSFPTTLNRGPRERGALLGRGSCLA